MILFAALALSAVPIRVEPPQLALSDFDASIEIIAPGITALQAEVTNGAGRISTPEPAGNGKFRARFSFPKDRFPQVALLAFTAADQRHWVSLPLIANANLKIETKPRASVTVTIGSAKFGPVTADAKGNASLPAKVPPGFSTATVVAVDRAGNSTTTPLDLAARPFSRASIAVPKTPATADQSLTLDVFAIEPDGSPLKNAAGLKVVSKQGSCEAPVAVGEGLFKVNCRAPKSVGEGKDTLSVELEGSTPSQVALPVKAGGPAKVSVTFQPPQYLAGSGKPVEVVAVVTDVFGNAVSAGRADLSADFGSVEAGGNGGKLSVPDSFGGRKVIHVRGVAGEIQGDAELPLKAAAPNSAELKMPNSAAVGDNAQGKLVLKDSFGNVAEAEGLEVVSSSGRAAQVSPAEDGSYAVEYAVAKEDPAGALSLEVRSGKQSLTRTELDVLPYLRAWAVQLSAFFSGAWNLGQVGSLSPRLGLGLRVGKTGFELGIDGAYYFSPQLRDIRALDPNTMMMSNDATVALSAWQVALTLRYSLQLSVRVSLHLAGSAGVQFTHGSVTAPSASDGNDNPKGVLLRGSGGVGFSVLGGRVMAQLEYSYAPVNSTHMRGNIGGLGAAVGYLISL
jgi:hypothetical protein